MGKAFFQVYSYILHCLNRKDEHSLHSPFLFDFYVKVVKNKALFKVELIEKYRSSLLQNKSVIEIEELGALSKNHSVLQIKNKASTSISSYLQSYFMGALVNYFKPTVLLEIGTSFGVSTAYLSNYSHNSKIVTLEGVKSIASVAQDFFKRVPFNNIELILGDFEQTLLPAIEKLPSLDFIFFDGNHQYLPTIQYFERCLKHKNENSVFVFHDIYWSYEMKRAWKTIMANAEVTLSIDLFYFGIVFFRNNQPKQHFILKF